MTIWRRLAAATGALALAAGLAAPAAHADTNPTLPPGARLACRAALVQSAPTAACNWVVGVTDYSAVELWRGTGENGDLSRVKVFTTDDHSVQRYVDATVAVGERYGYVLTVLGADGTPVARSNVAFAGLAQRPEVLVLTCTKSAERTVHCEWPAPTSSNASKLVLYGAVNRGPRTVLTTVEPAAGGSFDVKIPAGAWAMRFALVGFDSAGKIVGRSPVVLLAVGRPHR